MKMSRILKICLLITISLCVSVSFTFAATANSSLVDTYNFKFGLDVRRVNYEEPDLNVDIDGSMYGFSGEFTYHGISQMDNYIMAALELEALGGGLDYEGQTQTGTPVETSCDDWLVETRGLIGYEYLTDNANIITPFIGLGYRYWNNKIEGAVGYEREVQYWYAPIGIKSLGSLSEEWSGGLTAEFDLFLGGTVKSHLSDFDSSYNDPEVDQDPFEGYGLRFSVQFTRDFETRGHSLTFEPYVRYWDIDRSDREDLTSNGSTIAQVYEPENETTSFGMKLSLSF